MGNATTLKLGTRGSALALWQAHHVAQRIHDFHADVRVEIVVVKTTGDLRQDIPLQNMAGKGVFVTEIEAALGRGEIDFAVHSAKDLQSVNPPDLVIAAFCARADARDAVVSRNGEKLADFPPNASVATSSPRRIAQLLHVRPDLQFVQIRGNVDTRLAKLARGEADALILACAGLDRLNKSDVITERIGFDICLPQVGQACVAVQCRETDIQTRQIIQSACDDAPTRGAVEAERAFLALLGGGCSAPVAAHALYTSENVLSLAGQVASPDGVYLTSATRQETRPNPAAIAQHVFDTLMTDANAPRLLTT